MAENRVTVDGEGKLTLATANQRHAEERALQKQLTLDAGKLRMEADHLFHRFAYMKNEIPVAGVAHQAWTCRMGEDAGSRRRPRLPRARDRQPVHRRHERVPVIGAVNPALTAMANSIRVGDHLLERMGARVEAAGL